MWRKKMLLSVPLTGLLLLLMLCNAQESKGDVLIEMEALGRPLYPGSMYDCRTESFIPGIALWDEEALREHRHVRKQYETDLKVSSINSFSEKASLLNMSTSLRASFLGGMLGDGGYARYLMDSKSSARQSRVTLRYSQIRRFEELTLTELGNITYTYAFQHKLATHMITAVLYGAQCFMVFSYTASDDEDQQEVERNLLTMVKKIPSFTIERDGSVSLNENETKMAKKIRFALYGDFSLRRIPITFTDVVTLYKELPSLMTEDDAVPVRVWLYPLMLLDDRAAKLEREISASLVSKVGHLLEELVDIQRRCNDLITIRSRNDFRDVKQRLQKFKHLPHYYMLEFQTALQKALRAIRGGEQEEQVLIDILNTHYNSPFTAYNLNKWLDNIATEINILSSYTRELKDTPVVTSSIIPFVADIVVCLSFTSLRYEDKYLETLNDFQFSAALGQTNHTTNISQQLEPWFTGDVLKNMDRTLSRFTSFLKANKNRKGIGFIIAAFPDPNNPGASIQLYKQGRLVNPNFEPVSRPPPPILKTQDGGLTLILQKSPTGDTIQFRVEYGEVKPSGQEGSWVTRDTPDTQIHFILNGLHPKKQYCFQYRAVGPVGFSEPSECVYYPPIHDDKISPILVGGNGGSEWTFKTCNFSGPLKEMTVSVTDKVNAISLTRSNDHKEHFGHHTNESSKTFTFQDGDKFLSLILWPNQVGDRLGGVEFEVVRKNGQRQTFSARSSSLGSPVHMDVGSGICCGFVGRSSNDINALGFVFLK